MSPAAFGRLCVETRSVKRKPYAPKRPAAFGRLCVETSQGTPLKEITNQPPSGGCVLKPLNVAGMAGASAQPPSGGCVLKRHRLRLECLSVEPAAFGRLCVETTVCYCYQSIACNQPPSGGCVLKLHGFADCFSGRCQPPSGGCVLKLDKLK
mgnify:CR=1 FL=1